MERLQSQIEFLLTCDRLKSVARTTYLHDASRPENSSEHSWHLTLMALTLEEYAPAGTVVSHAVNMLIVHDLVEIYAGDTYFGVDQTTLERQHAYSSQCGTQFRSNAAPEYGGTRHPSIRSRAEVILGVQPSPR